MPKKSKKVAPNDYAYKTIAEYESIVGGVNESFKIGWQMARTTNAQIRAICKSAAARRIKPKTKEPSHA